MTHEAVEQASVETAADRLGAARQRVTSVLARVTPILGMPRGAEILDIGAAQGLHVAALEELGFRGIGLEPWSAAVAASDEIAQITGQRVDVREGVAERLPFADESFSLVIALSVIEHVEDPAAAFAEAYRVLRPGGGFYLTAASALCPRQPEIRRFPLFPWYPDRLRRRIMAWAARTRPSLVGGTTTPAINWHTPWGLRSDLAAVGFEHFYDRWQLRVSSSDRSLRASAVRAGNSWLPVRLLGDIVVPGLAVLAVKPSAGNTPNTNEGSASP